MKKTIQRFIPSNGKGEGFVMVLRDNGGEESEKTEGGLFKPQRAIELANQGEVRAAYEGCQYQVGDRVVFTKYSGSEFELNGVLYILLKEKEVQGKTATYEVEISDDLLARPQTQEDVNDAAQKALALLAQSATAENPGA